MRINEYESKHLAAIRDGLAECMVLLKSDETFPLERPCKIAAFGAGVRHTIKGGTGSGEVNSRFYINVEQGLEQAGFEITTKSWLDDYEQVPVEAKAQFKQALKAKAKKEHTNLFAAGMGATMDPPDYDIPLKGEGDVAIYVVSRICGEGNDRSDADVKLNQSEIRDILQLNSTYKKFMLILNVGGVVDLTPVMEVRNILVLSQLGVEMGAALADVLLGKESPSGKLATTWAGLEDYCQIGNFAHKDDTYYKEGIYVGYRYFDTVGKKPLFPFGFGLNYGKTAIINSSATIKGSVITVRATVENSGAMATKEAVQVYVSSPTVRLDKPYQALATFAKTKKINPGQSENVELCFDMADIASYDTANSAYILEPGDYVVRTGLSSDATVETVIVRVSEEITVRKVRNAYGDAGFVDYVPENPVVDKPEGIPILELAKDAISTDVVSYEYDETVDERIAKLTDEECARLNMGLFGDKGKILSVIGDQAATVAGAAGETAHVDGIPYAVMADGPAGLRLSKQYFKDEKGAHAVGSAMLESMEDMLPGPLKLLLKVTAKKPKKNQQIYEQYTTAIPIGTAIAQSFNTEFARVCGDIVGQEMQQFGVHIWLAPALNIHRDIRCGRNFEYFSEDPYVSGVFAAAITAGVQSHEGCATTIKHYAANNQEINRYANNSHVSERALREIYLRGFEICIRQSQPKCLMTSYNLLNGTHTNERRDLVEDTLRCEWGYKGMVMTDWIIARDLLTKGAKYKDETPTNVAKSGNDVFMPGSKADFDKLMTSLNSGEIDRHTLDINATRVLKVVSELTK